MESIALVKKVPKSKRITIHLSKFEPGQEVEVQLLVKLLSPTKRSKPFDMVKWAEKWATDLGEEVRSDDVESFTGRRF